MQVFAEVVRSGLVESSHRGIVVQVDSAGAVVHSWGDPDTVMYPRSSSKPVQALAMIEAGLSLAPKLLALAWASHSAENFHLSGVRQILADHGLSESDLQTPPERRRGEYAAIHHGCSGKHAAMLASCVINDWPTDSYLDPQHPLQVRITEKLTKLTQVSPPVIAIDGCGAPQHATTISGLARAIASIVSPTAAQAARDIVESGSQYPEFVSGTQRPELEFMRSFPGVLAKSGAEGVFVLGLPAGGAIAIKTEDGSERAMYAVMRRILQLHGWTDPMLDERPKVLGGSQVVGEIRVTI